MPHRGRTRRAHGTANPAVRQLTAGGARGGAAERPVHAIHSGDRANDIPRRRMNGAAAGMLRAAGAIGETAGDRDARRPVPRCHDGDRCLTGAQADTCEGLHVPWTLASTATATRGPAVSSPAGAGCAITGCHAHTSAPKRSASRKGARCVRRWTMSRKNGDSFAWDSRCAAPRLADSHAQRTLRNFRAIPMYGVVCIPILRIAGPPRSSWPRFARRRWSPRRHVRGLPLHRPGEARWGSICR